MTNDQLSVYTNDKSYHLDPTIYARYHTIKSIIFNFGHIITGKEQDGNIVLSLMLVILITEYYSI